MNNVNLIVRLTRDPEVNYTPSGKAICSFGVALDKGYGDHKHAVYMDCKIWEKKGETFAQYVKKGQQVGITAELDMESWEDKTSGQKRTKLCLDVRDFTLIGNKQDGGSSEPQQRAQSKSTGYSSRPAVRQQEAYSEPQDDDIAF